MLCYWHGLSLGGSMRRLHVGKGSPASAILLLQPHLTSCRSWLKVISSFLLSLWRWPSCTLEKAMAPHSSTLAWKIPWTEEPDGLQSMGSLKVGNDWVTSLKLFTFTHSRRKWQPTQCSCLENPRDGGAWWAAVYGVAQSRTRLKRLSSSSSSSSSILYICSSWH